MNESANLVTEQIVAEGLQLLDYFVIALYLAGVLAAGWYFSRQQEQQDDYFVGGRKLPWMAVGLSIVATMLSTVTYLAAPGEVIQHGLALSIGWLAMPLAFLVVNFLWVPFFMRLGVTSIYEYLDDRFGLAARLTAVALFVLILRLLWMATIVLTGSRAVAQITHESMVRLFGLQLSPDQWLLVVLASVGLFATLYTMLGGIKAVVWTDVAQFVALVSGVLFTLFFVAWKTGTGPVDWWVTTTSTQLAGHELPPLASWDITTRNTILFAVLSATFWYSCTFIGDQVAVQRFLTTPSVSAAIKGNIVNFVADFLIMILLAMCGMALLTYYLDPAFQTVIADGVSDPRDKSVADQVFPHFITYGLPVGVSGLVVAALFAVAMSSLDSGINSVAAVLTIDVFRRLQPSTWSDQGLWLPRAITIVVGFVSTLLAWAMLSIPEQYNIIGITMRTFNCALGPLGAMFVVGMFVRRAGQTAVVIGACLGLAMSVSVAWWVELNWALGLTDYVTLTEATDNVKGPSPFLITPISSTFTVAMAVLLSFVFANSKAEATEQLLWSAVVAREDREL
jgi:SSS family transporter